MEQVRSENYSKAELAVLRDYIVVNANELAEQMERDADGYLIYKGDMNQAAAEAMQRVGTDYGRLQGYYPQPKEIYFSELLSQTYMMGYYFPFSMEANYNGTMYIVNKPSVICHEFAHLKGFMQEDEANLIGYLACINSDDAFSATAAIWACSIMWKKNFVRASKRAGKNTRSIRRFLHRFMRITCF